MRPMTDAMTFSSKLHELSIECLVVDDTPWFVGANIATILGYSNPNQAIMDHVDDEDKRQGENDLETGILINESGIYSLIHRSDQPMAKAFKRWVVSEVIPEIRRNGCYQGSSKEQQEELEEDSDEEPDPFDERNWTKIRSFTLFHEQSLHKKVVQWIRRFQPDAMIFPGMGELQKTEEQRLDAWAKGYMRGTPDLLVFGALVVHGLAIEFKAPKGRGTLKDEQRDMMRKLQLRGFRVIVSNDYDDIIYRLMEFFRNAGGEE